MNAMQEARRYARELEGREKHDRQLGLLIFLLLIALAGFACFLAAKM